jgi:integral membrane protein (TIGR01906 family)
MPGFPEDPYGFTIEDRLKWSKISIDYLLNDSEISFLADQQFADGTPLYNERELSHMLDVKRLFQRMVAGWWFLVILFVVLGIWAWKEKWLAEFWRAVSLGGWLTIGLIMTILVGIAVSFSALFTTFHRLFFTGDTWIFLYSDTLIRLFPMRFWQDGFIAMGLITIGMALAAGLLGREWANPLP